MFREFLGLFGHVRRPQHRSAAARRAGRPYRGWLRVEELEARLVPSWTVSTFGGVFRAVEGSNPNTPLTVTVLNGQDAILANGQTFTSSPALHNRIEIDGNGNGATVTVQANLTAVTAVLRGNSTANVGNGSLSGIGDTVYLENPPDHNVVNIDDHNDSAAHTATIGTFATGQSTGYLAGVSPGIIEWVSADTSQANIVLGPGTSTVNVEGVSAPTVVSNRATATVNVGSGGSLSGILRPLFLENPPSFDTVNIFDQNDSAAHTATIRNPVSLNELTGVAPGIIRWVSADTSQANIHLGPGTSTVNVQGISVPTTVFNQALATVNVGFNGNLSAIQATLLLENEPSFDTVNIFDQNDFAAHTATISTVTRPGDSSLGQLAGVSPGVIRWDYLDTSQANIHLGPGTSTVNVQGIGVPTTVFNQAFATVNVGLNGRVSGILRTLLLENEPSFDTVNIFDQNDLDPHTAFISTVTRPGDSPLGQLAGISPGVIQWDTWDTSAVNIHLGPGTTIVNVLGTGVLTNLFNVAAATVNIGSGDSVADIQGALRLENELGYDTVFINDQADTTARTAIIDTLFRDRDTPLGRLTIHGVAPITWDDPYTSSVTVNTGSGGAAVTVLSTSPTTAVTVNGNPAAVNALGDANLDTTWGILSTNAGFFSNSAATVHFTGFGNLSGDSSNDIFNFLTDGARITGTIYGGGGSNTLDLSAMSVDLTVNVLRANVGYIPGVVGEFDFIQNVTTGSGNDRFVFRDGASLSGTVDGGGGSDTLDYSSGWSGNTLVNLQTGTASGIGHVSNVQNVLGASGGGAGFYNILVGNGGNLLQGGFGRRNLLTAGGAASTLIGGDDDDILIGGTTAYDAEADMHSLIAIMNYWANTGYFDPYATRVNNLLYGVGVPVLDAAHATSNGGGNLMQGNGGGAGELNLFYGDLALDSYDWDPATETFVSV
jgi:hypothetical protein